MLRTLNVSLLGLLLSLVPGNCQGGGGGGESGGESGGEGGSGSGGSSTDFSYINETVYSAYYGIASRSSYSFTMDVLLDCSKVIFTFVDENDDTTYSSWGIGGDYSGSGDAKMDGYAIIIQDDYVWETTLNGNAFPEEQSQDDLSCYQDKSGSTRTSVCRRAYDTGDSNDFTSYSFGTIDVIYANGDVSGGDIEQHQGGSSAGESTMEVVGMGCQDLSNYAYYFGGSVDEYSMEVSVDLSCTTVTFTFTDNDDAATYSSWGFGGDYSGSGKDKMDGYSIIIQDGTAWETTLTSGGFPVEQTQEDLTCTQTSLDGVRTTECTRDFDTGDSNDWNDFQFYFNDFIWAFGSVTDGEPDEHGHDDAGTITAYVYGEGCDGAGKPTTTELKGSDDSSGNSDSGSQTGGDSDDCLNCSFANSNLNVSKVFYAMLFVLFVWFV